MNDIDVRSPAARSTSESGDYRWAADGELYEAHAFPPVPDGRLPGRSVCGQRRWTVAFGHAGHRKCLACMTELKDLFRAVSVALTAAGVCLDR